MSKNRRLDLKDIDGKYDPSYLFRSAKIAVHHVREYGSKKYLNRDTWIKTNKEEYLKAAERHLDALKEGEEFAKDSGLPHIWHALCDIMFFIEREKMDMKKLEEDNEMENASYEYSREEEKRRHELKRSLYGVN